MNEIEAQIINNARSHKALRRPQYESPSGKYTSWFQFIHKHYEGTVLPELQRSKERLVDYWPCYTVVEARVDTNISSGTSFRSYFGKYGSGYLCLTSRHVRLFTFDPLTQKYPPFTQGAKGLFREVSTAFFGSPEAFRVVGIRSDKTWTFPLSSISACELQTRISARAVELKTDYGKFDILEVFRDHLEVIHTALHLARGSKLDAIWDQWESTSSAIVDANEELLKKLEDLRAAGIITQAEFDEKKAKLSTSPRRA